MSEERTVFKSASWLTFFKVISQMFSWTATILVARLLVPGDYGLMAMATIITGYAEMFGELGVGAALIQRPVLTKEDLSSVFWFNLAFSMLLAGGCFIAAYPTAYLFHEPKVIPLTQTVSVLFIISGLQIVPHNLLKKKQEFKKIGFIEMVTTLISCLAMPLMAYLGAGVWTLIGGRIVRSATKLVMVYNYLGWYPKFIFSFERAKSLLRFGVTVALGNSLFYVYDKSDRFFAGRAWSASILGYYTFALELAQIPTEKIVVLINQVSFPSFAKLQNDRISFNRFYLNINKITAIIVLPLFACGFLLGNELVRILLNEKWVPIIPLFRYLCLAQIFTALIAVNNFVHIAKGNPRYSFIFNAICAVLMPISFAIAVQGGLYAMILPWVTIYVLICSCWIVFTLRKIGVGVGTYMRNLLSPFIGTLIMGAAVLCMDMVLKILFAAPLHIIMLLGIKTVIAFTVYLAYLAFFDREYLKKIYSLRTA